MKSLLLFALALSPSLALANSATDLADIDKAFQGCIAKNDDNLGMKICTGDAYEAADQLLNRVYKNTTLELKKKSGDKYTDESNVEILKRLTTAQRAWIPYRDAQCRLEGTSMLGGSGEALVITGCLYEATVARVKAIGEVGSSGN